MEISQNQFNQEFLAIAREAKTPVAGVFELTGRCNLACSMCYVRKPAADRQAISAELTAEGWLQIGRQAAEAGMLYLLLTGGEVFLRPDFFEIYEGLSNLGLQISLNTNATLITPETARRLAALPPRQIAVTLYGASAATYAHVCGDGTAFERALRGARLLREQGLNVRIRTTIIRQNRADLEKIYALAQELGSTGSPLRLVDYVFAGREQQETDPFAVRLPPREQRECTLFLRKLAGSQETPTAKAQDKKEQPEEPQMEKTAGPQSSNAFQCAVGHYSFSINAGGRLNACLMLNEPGLPLTDGFARGWEKLKKLCDAVPVCQECAACQIKQYCKVCPAKLKGETGFFDRKAPYLCEIAKLAAAES